MDSDYIVRDHSLSGTSYSDASLHPFASVQQVIYDRLQAIGGVFPKRVGRVYLAVENIEYLFYEFLRRFTEETGAEVLPENQTLEDYAEVLVNTYYGLIDSFDNEDAPDDQQMTDLVMAWNTCTIDYMLTATMRAYNRQNNYVRRYKDYKYGVKLWDPVKPISKKTKRIELNVLQNYAAIGTTLGKPRYPVRDFC